MTKAELSLTKLAVLSMSVCLMSGPASAQTCYSDIIAVGDSLTDTGNFFGFFSIPLPPYANGRLSNGPIWLDGLAASLGLSSLNSSSGGRNYAWAGARTGPVGGLLPPFSLLDQIGFYLADVGGVADPNALYVVWGGANDARENDVAVAASDIAAIISDLASVGATNFLVPNLFDLGTTPESLAGNAPGGTAAQITAATVAHNAALAAELSALSATLTTATITELDVFTQFNQILSDPGGFGFTNVTVPCWDGDSNGNGTQCANPGEYLYWDSVRPTTAAHTLIGNEAFNLVVDTDGDCNPDITDPDDDNDGIGDVYDRDRLVADNNCTTNDGTNATLVSAQVMADQTCASKESVDVNGDNGTLNTVVFGPGGDLRLISEKVIFNDTNVEVDGRLEVINADPCPGCVVYAIGDIGPAGGKVFYITDGGLHGLEAALADQTNSAQWGCYATAITGADDTDIGTGAQNTADVLAGCATAGIAASVADSYEFNGFSDWFLPSKDELNELYIQRAVVGGFSNGVYWSSSEIDGFYAWLQAFISGAQDDQLKFNTYSVRAVRAF